MSDTDQSAQSPARDPATEQDEPRELADGSWLMWAVWRHEQFMGTGDRRSAFHYGSGDEQPVQVRVMEHEAGDHWGWIRAGERQPVMIYGHLMGLRMCFPYGIEVAEKAGDGRAACLHIARVE